MATARQVLFGIIAIILFTSSTILDVHAGKSLSSKCSHKINVYNDMPPEITTTILWLSSMAKKPGGICYAQVIDTNRSASYTFTKEQTQGFLCLAVIAESSKYKSQNKVTVGWCPLTANAHKKKKLSTQEILDGTKYIDTKKILQIFHLDTTA